MKARGWTRDQDGLNREVISRAHGVVESGNDWMELRVHLEFRRMDGSGKIMHVDMTVAEANLLTAQVYQATLQAADIVTTQKDRLAGKVTR